MLMYSPRSRRSATMLQVPARPASLQGLRIGLLDNTKAPVDKMLLHLEAQLKQRLPGVQTFRIAKQGMGLPASAEVLASLRQQADVLINALGD